MGGDKRWVRLRGRSRVFICEHLSVVTISYSIFHEIISTKLFMNLSTKQYFSTVIQSSPGTISVAKRYLMLGFL